MTEMTRTGKSKCSIRSTSIGTPNGTRFIKMAHTGYTSRYSKHSSKRIKMRIQDSSSTWKDIETHVHSSRSLFIIRLYVFLFLSEQVHDKYLRLLFFSLLFVIYNVQVAATPVTLYAHDILYQIPSAVLPEQIHHHYSFILIYSRLYTVFNIIFSIMRHTIPQQLQLQPPIHEYFELFICKNGEAMVEFFESNIQIIRRK